MMLVQEETAIPFGIEKGRTKGNEVGQGERKGNNNDYFLETSKRRRKKSSI